MFLHSRNTYKTRKIMLLYCITSIVGFAFAFWGITISIAFNIWWINVINLLFLAISVMSFFLLYLENNDYDIKHYFNRKRFKELYDKLIDKYKIENKKIKKKIKKEAKDCFFQYGEIVVQNSELETLIFSDWLERYSQDNYIRRNNNDRLSVFLYYLLGITGLYGDYKSNLKNLMDVYSKEDISMLLDECLYVKNEFKEKCLFFCDYSCFASDEFLKNMYLELIYIIEGVIGLLSKEEFDSMMYNPNYYYSKDKRIACSIEEDNGMFNVLINDLQYRYVETLVESCESKEKAIEIIDDYLNTSN